MATLKKINRNPSLSAKMQTAPGAGMAAIFAALADTLGNAVDYYLPGAIEEMQRRGADEGHAAAGGGLTGPLAAPAGPVDPNSMIGDDAMKALVRTGLISRGLPEHVADGIMMNIADESGFNLGAVGDNGNAFGLVQWNGPRKAALEQFAAGRGSSPGDLDTQLDFLVQELEGPERGAYDSLLRTGSASEAAVAFLNDFERPAETHRSRREAKYRSGSTVVSTSDQTLGMIGGVKPDGGTYQSLDGSGTAHAPDYKDYSQLFREYRFDPPDDTWVAVGERDGKTLYAAPDYARDESGNYLSVSAADAQRLAQERGTVIPTRDEVKALYGKAEKIPMPTQPIGETGGTGDSAAYTAAVGEVPAGKAVVHGKEFFSSSGQATPQNAPTAPSAPAQATGGIRQPKLYSPYSGPLLRAHNAAAEAAFNAEILNKAEVDFQSLRNNFLLDPGGFGQAARSYVDEIVSQAPAQFRSGLRETLNGQIASTQTSILSAQQADTRQRAANSTGALADRLSNQYAEALAAGDADGAMKARSELEQVLRTRENLPGLSWTREQSENVLLKAMDAADTIRAKQASEQVKEWKSALDTIVKAAGDGMSASDEDLLSDPAVWEALPSEAAEAQAYVTLRDAFPEFFKLPPDVALEMARNVQDTPVQEGWEVDVASAAMDAAKANKIAWENDPIKRASEVMDTKPVPMPEYVPGQEGAIVDWLKGRQEYGYALRDQGYSDEPVFLSEEELKSFSELLGKDVDPAIRGGVAGIIVAGLGVDAVSVFDALKVDTVTQYAGKMMAIGGNEQTAMLAMQGQSMIAQGLVDMPSDKVFKSGMTPRMAQAFAGIPGSIDAQGEVLQFAAAIYASQAQGLATDSPEALALMDESIQMALGQETNARGRKTGGIQATLGFDTLLPVGMSAEQVQSAFAKATSRLPHEGGGFLSGMANLGAALLGDTAEFDEATWRAASGVDQGSGWEPMLNGKPLDPSLFGNDSVRLVASGGPFYRMEIITSGGPVNIEDASGNIMMIDLEAMVEAAQ